MLESIARRSRDLGGLRVVPDRRTGYVSCGELLGKVVRRSRSHVGSNMARDSFATFLPLSVDSDARLKIIFDFFDLMAAIAAYGKNNGFGGRKLSRLAGWWAFDHSDQGDGFEGGYRSWAR